MLFLVWIAYTSKTFIFTYCPSAPPLCKSGDFLNNPGDALANNYNINEILHIDSNGNMTYDRPVKISGCTPEKKTVNVEYPQYCSFQNSVNGAQGVWKDTSFGSNVYVPVEGTVGPTITTGGNCHPVNSSYNRNKVLLRWDANPISEL